MHQAAVAQWGKNFAQKIDLTPYKNILDVGCRKGWVSRALALQYLQNNIYAIDNVPSEIEYANSFSSANLEFATSNALDLPFQEDFDAVVSFNCLFWIQNKIQALKEIYRSLKPGGKAFFQFFVTHGRLRNDYFVYYVANQPQWRSYFKGFHTDYYEITLQEFGSLLQQVGFTIQRMEFSRNPVTLDHPDALANFIKSWASHTKFLPLNKQDHFYQEISKAYLDFHHYPTQAPFTYFEYLLEVICEKGSSEEMLPSSDTFQFGDICFSRREAQILKHFLQGKSSKEIGNVLSISAKTVEFHLQNVRERLGCHKRSELVQSALTHGFIHLMFDTFL